MGDTVFTTNEYEKFTYLIKKKNDERARKILESFRKYGYINCPITINENFEIIDGRARLEAFKHFQLPVEYIIIEGAGIEDCYKLNKDKNTWTKEDYKYAKLEIEKNDNSVIFCQGCKVNSKIQTMIDYQIKYWIKQKLKLEGMDINDNSLIEKEIKEEIKAARREYQRKFYEKHPEKRKEYQDRFYKRQADSYKMEADKAVYEPEDEPEQSEF